MKKISIKAFELYLENMRELKEDKKHLDFYNRRSYKVTRNTLKQIISHCKFEKELYNYMLEDDIINIDEFIDTKRALTSLIAICEVEIEWLGK